MSIDQSMLVLTKEPFVGYMPKDICALISSEISEKNLALVFACVSNKTGSLFCELDEGDEWVRYAFHAWDEVQEQLMEMIFAVLIEEGRISKVPDTGKYYALNPFMERNGYKAYDNGGIQAGTDRATGVHQSNQSEVWGTADDGRGDRADDRRTRKVKAWGNLSAKRRLEIVNAVRRLYASCGKNPGGSQGRVAGAGNYDFKTYPLATTQGINHLISVVEGIDERMKLWNKNFSEAKGDLQTQKEIASAPFDQADKIRQKRARYNEVMDILNPPKEEQTLDSDGGDTVQYQRRKNFSEGSCPSGWWVPKDNEKSPGS